MKRNFKITLQYEGTRYRGWQKQGNTDNTVQARVERALENLCGAPVEARGSGRTDAGVHALGQVVSAAMDTDLTPQEVRDGLNAHLPADIAARCARWSRIQAARTVGCTERYKLDKKNGTVLIRNDFDYLVIPNDWGVEPEYVAPVPPLLPLYAKSGNVKFADGTADLDYATLQGPLHGVSGKRSEYTLAIPEVDYPLPVTATDVVTMRVGCVTSLAAYSAPRLQVLPLTDTTAPSSSVTSMRQPMGQLIQVMISFFCKEGFLLRKMID